MSDDNLPIPSGNVNLPELFTFSYRYIAAAGTVPTINARELHSFLELRTKFADWVKRRIDEYGFSEDIDFVAILENGNSPPSKEYHLSLDMAKELSMVERNAKGREARHYFLECERRLKDANRALTPAEQLVRSAQALLDHERKIAWLADEQARISDQQIVNNRVANVAMETALEARKLAAIAEAKAQASNMPYHDFTIMAYSNIIKARISFAEAKKLGATATKLSNARKQSVGRAKDQRFGYVNTYTLEILEEVFKDYHDDVASDL